MTTLPTGVREAGSPRQQEGMCAISFGESESLCVSHAALTRTLFLSQVIASLKNARFSLMNEFYRFHPNDVNPAGRPVPSGVPSVPHDFVKAGLHLLIQKRTDLSTQEIINPNPHAARFRHLEWNLRASIERIGKVRTERITVRQ